MTKKDKLLVIILFVVFATAGIAGMFWFESPEYWKGQSFAPVEDDTMWVMPPARLQSVDMESADEPIIILWIYTEEAERDVQQFGILAEWHDAPKFLLEVSPEFNFDEVVEYIRNYDNKNNKEK